MTSLQTATTPARTSNRTAMRATAVFSCLFLLVAAWLLLVTMRGALDGERAFRAAVACAPDSPSPDGAAVDCLRTVSARIDETEAVEGRKSSSFWMYLTEADGTSSRTRLTGTPREHPDARAGARIDVTYWQGQIRYVDFASDAAGSADPGSEPVRRYTTADPRGDYKLFMAWGLAFGFQGLGYAWGWFWYWWVDRSRAAARMRIRAYAWQFIVPFMGAFCLTAVGAIAPWPTAGPGAAFRLVGVCGAVVLAVCALVGLAVWWRQRGDDTIALTPSVPDTEQHFPGVILGEVPYAGRGGHLVAGPAGLATARDRPRASAPRAVPRTLTPVRVRPPYWTDPAGRPDYDGRVVVLECEDDGVPVLIATRRKKMPWVLGALGTVAASPRE